MRRESGGINPDDEHRRAVLEAKLDTLAQRKIEQQRLVDDLERSLEAAEQALQAILVDEQQLRQELDEIPDIPDVPQL